MVQRTYVMIKPDAMTRGLAGKIIDKLLEPGFKIKGIKYIQLTPETVEKHYAHLVHFDFFPELSGFMTSAPVIGMILEGENVITRVREIMGATDPKVALPGTIRNTWAESKTLNLIHGSDSVESAEEEIKRFFGEGNPVEFI